MAERIVAGAKEIKSVTVQNCVFCNFLLKVRVHLRERHKLAVRIVGGATYVR